MVVIGEPFQLRKSLVRGGQLEAGQLRQCLRPHGRVATLSSAGAPSDSSVNDASEPLQLATAPISSPLQISISVPCARRQSAPHDTPSCTTNSTAWHDARSRPPSSGSLPRGGGPLARQRATRASRAERISNARVLAAFPSLRRYFATSPPSKRSARDTRGSARGRGPPSRGAGATALTAHRRRTAPPALGGGVMSIVAAPQSRAAVARRSPRAAVPRRSPRAAVPRRSRRVAVSTPQSLRPCARAMAACEPSPLRCSSAPPLLRSLTLSLLRSFPSSPAFRLNRTQPPGRAAATAEPTKGTIALTPGGGDGSGSSPARPHCVTPPGSMPPRS